MKKLLLAAILFLGATPCRAAIAVSASAGTVLGAGAGTVVVTINTSTGHTVCIVGAHHGNVPVFSAVVDSGGSTYSLMVNSDLGGGRDSEIWCTAVNASIASTTVTGTWTVGSSIGSAYVVDLTGVNGFGNTGIATTSSGTNITVTVTTQDANNWILMGTSTSTGQCPIAAAGGSTIDQQGDAINSCGAAAHQSFASPGSNTISLTGQGGNSATSGLELRSAAPTPSGSGVGGKAGFGGKAGIG